MPRFSRKSKRRTDDSEGIVDHLLSGSCLPCLFNQVNHDGDVLRPEWERLRDVLQPQFVREHPGERPWAWWAFAAPSRRERIDGGVHPFDNAERTLHVARSDSPDFWRVAYRLAFGYPSAFIMPYDRDFKVEQYEQTWEYLARHELLLPEDLP